MTNKPESGIPEEADSLSATGMFLRAFGESPKADQPPADPLKASPGEVPNRPGAPRPAAPTAAAGEFTQMFNAPEPRQSSSPASAVPAEPRPGTPPARTSGQFPTEQAADRGPGEFTRVFVSGVAPPAPVSPKASEEPTKASQLPAAGQSRSKGFSAPGVSGSASGEGSFTQLFNAATPGAPSRPPAVQPAASAARSSAWDNDPIFRNPQNSSPSEPPSPSVTSLLASLGTDKGPAAGRQPEPAPYRPESSFRTPPPVSSEPSDGSSGGVTRLIQRLAQTPAEPAPVSPSAPPASSGPGEFTRMISRMAPSAPATEPPATAPQAGPPAGAPFAPPPLPAIASPPIPPTPKFAAAPIAAAAMPAAPQPPALAAPALAAPKSKLESMVPILLVINTFLLLILLIVVIFLIKGR